LHYFEKENGIRQYDMGYPNQTCDVSKVFIHIQTIHVDEKTKRKMTQDLCGKFYFLCLLYHAFTLLKIV
jgi:hypothetical protein